MSPPCRALAPFHAATQAWFSQHIGQPSPVQEQGWPEINLGGHVLMAAPTGSGKTLAALLHALDALVKESRTGPLPAQVRVLYVSPLKALSTDVHYNLETPLAGIAAVLDAMGERPLDVRVGCRTGDTSPGERQRILRKPPHVLVTTPESLYLLLAAKSGHKLLSHVRTVIIDEVHALAANRRGSHLSLSLEHLQDITHEPLQRIGLSATQRPMDEVARFLVGMSNIDAAGRARCALVDVTTKPAVDVALSLPQNRLEAIMSHETWEQVYDQLVQLIGSHRTTLIFVNTRRMAERLAYTLALRLGEHTVVSHHGSLAASVRKVAEERLKKGDLRALVATGSLELGIDMGAIDLVCQMGSVRTIGSFLQRIGRANHHQGGMPKGRLFPLTRDELVECTALIRSLRGNALDTLEILPQPLDILAQQLVARVSALGDQPHSIATLRAWATRAYPYRHLTEKLFADVLTMVADGYATRRGRRGTLLHIDRVNQQVRPRRGAQLAALTCGGAIADTGDFRVLLMPEELMVGHVTEEFAVDSQRGDVFVLGTMHWRILKIHSGAVWVEDAHDAPPSVPSWAGEAPSRSHALCHEVGALRLLVAQHLHDREAIIAQLAADAALPRHAMEQLVDYLHAAQHALGAMPHHKLLVAERFFDSAGGMQMVLHCPFGSRLNRAFGLALRKRFCKSFNFELQAAANEDCIVLSLGEVHAFGLADVFRFLNAKTVRHVLIQALLDAPMFETRWRWNAGRSLAVLRMWAGKKVPPQVLRMQAEDLVSAVFPDQIACLENIQGERRVPEHPLVQQTIDDCLHEAMDIDGLVDLLTRLGDGRLPFIAVDTPEPSALCHEILLAKPYAFLDDGDAEQRRTHAVHLRRDLRTADEPGAAGVVSAAALAKLQQEVWPRAHTVDEVHDGLTTMVLGMAQLIDEHSAHWLPHLRALHAQGRAALVAVGDHHSAWVCTEHLPVWAAASAQLGGAVALPELGAKGQRLLATLQPVAADAALVKIVAGLLQVLGPTTCDELAAMTGLAAAHIDEALLALESQGIAMRGAFRTVALRADCRPEWCERRLLARLHRYTVQGRRKATQAVSQATFQRFLWQWHGVCAADDRALYDAPQGAARVREVLQQLGGLELPAKAWEADVLPSRVRHFAASDLDQLCLSGEMCWGRISRPDATSRPRKPLATSPMAVMARADAWAFLQPLPAGELRSAPRHATSLSVLRLLERKGALFTMEIVRLTELTDFQVALALGELAALGLVTSDGFMGLRALLAARAQTAVSKRGLKDLPALSLQHIDRAGRWSLSAAMDNTMLPRASAKSSAADGRHAEQACAVRVRMLLQRWGVLCRELLLQEKLLGSWPQMLRQLRLMELRGEVMGGHFVSGLTGEQFALPEAVRQLAHLREAPPARTLAVLSAADPLNLTGILPGSKRVPRVRKHRLICRDGVAIAYWGKSALHRLVSDEASDYQLLAALAEHNTLRTHQACHIKKTPAAAVHPIPTGG